jgi:pSer/pThr/pTyr-binding forkhead associated (FHA) protein
MARLILTLEGQALAEYNMSKERYTVGRLPDNDVRIDNAAVSGHHALIINILNDSFLEDLNSTNGTYVNGKLIKKHVLQHGDVVTVGHHQLRFVDSQVEGDGSDDFAKTLVIQSKSDATDDRLPALAVRPAVGSGTGTGGAIVGTDGKPRHPPTIAVAISVHRNAKVQVLSGPFAGREMELTKVLTTLGRPGVQVAAITRRAEAHYLVHVESGATGSFPLVNGNPIGAQAQRLRDNDVITLAGVKMAFFEG